MELQRPISRRVNLGEAERKVSLVTGLGLLVYVLTHRSKMSLPLGLEAGYMLYRGATGHCVIYQMMEINRSENGHKGIQVQRSVMLNRRRDELFRIWRNFENLPRFMKHLKSVRVSNTDNGRSHWVTTGPLGREIEWDSEIIEERENEYMAWSSLPGSIVESRGSVHFMDAPGKRGTILYVSMEYQPPAGSLGAAFAKLFGEEPSQQIRDDLRHFKQIMETGEAASVDGQPSGRNQHFEKSIAERERERERVLVGLASEESFAASDPPGWVAAKPVAAAKRRVS